MIASGKSTHAKMRAREGWVIINNDDVVNLIHANEYTLFNNELKPLYKSVQMHILYMAIAMGQNVVIDRTNLNVQSRQKWITVGKSLGVEVRAISFLKESQKIHATRRFDSDGRGYSYEQWLEVAKRHNQLWEQPILSEGFDEIWSEYEYNTLYKTSKKLVKTKDKS